MKTLALAAAMLLGAPPALGGASNFTLVNGTAGALSNMSIRRAGTEAWKPLAATPAPGARAPVAFKDDDCAFDISARLNGTAVTWAGVNLCDVKSVVLKNDASAGAWVDYDQ
jgi:hypothetical protein